jgi:hypothetical protein
LVLSGWLLLIMCIAAMPANRIFAQRMDFNPSIGRTTRLTEQALWKSRHSAGAIPASESQPFARMDRLNRRCIGSQTRPSLKPRRGSLTANAALPHPAGRAAATGQPAPPQVRVATYKQRCDRTAQRINTIPGLGCAIPDGAFYLYVNCSGIIGKHTRAGK